MLCCCCVKFYLNMCVNTPTILDDSHSEEFWFSSRTCLCQLKWQYMCVCLELSDVQLFVTPWTIACQAPLFMEFPRPQYWNGYLFSSPGDFSQLRDRTQVFHIAGRFFTIWATYSLPKEWHDILVASMLESRWPGEISITSDMQMIPHLWQKTKN